jgi:hypothetical protein
MTIVIQKVSGGVAVMRLVNDADAATCIAQWQAVNPGEYVSHAEVAEELLPQDRSARALWSLVDGAVVIDPSLTPVPQKVTRRQAIRALRLAGKYDLVQPAIDAILDQDQRQFMQDEWDESQEFERDRASLIAMATAIGLDSAAIDALFVTAAAL